MLNRLTFILFFLFSMLTYAQEVKIPLVVSDDNGATKTLYFGLDPKATAGLDNYLDEHILPPLPPLGDFDARFISIEGEPDGSWNDFRTGTKEFVREVIHTIQYQLGAGSIITIQYDLPSYVTGNFYDIVTGNLFNENISGKGELKITQPNVFSKLHLKVFYNILTNLNKSVELPKSFKLEQNYPNPFNPDTKINFSLAKATNVKLIIYDCLGREVSVLIDEYKPVGEHEAKFNAINLSSGVYFYKLITKEFNDRKKMILIK